MITKEFIQERIENYKIDLENYRKLRSKLQNNEEYIINELDIVQIETRINELEILNNLEFNN